MIVQQHEGSGDGLTDTRKRQISHTSDKTVVADLSGYGMSGYALGISMWQNPKNLGNTTSPDSHKYSPDTLMSPNRTTQQSYSGEHDAKLRLDGVQLKLRGLTRSLDITTPMKFMADHRIECPRPHDPGWHCQFCVNAAQYAFTRCMQQSATEDGRGDCPCTAHDARMEWPKGPDGFRRPENTMGVDLWDLDNENYEPDGGFSHGEGWLIAHGPVDQNAGFTWERGQLSDEFKGQFPAEAHLFETVRNTGRPNYQMARIPLDHGLHIDQELKLYHDKRLLDYLEFGFPLGYVSPEGPAQNYRNHASALNFPGHVEKYLQKELKFNSLIGPLQEMPTSAAHMNPLMSRPKKASTQRRIILDLSYAPNQQSVNNGIPKCTLEGEFVKTALPTPQHLAHELLLSDRGTVMYGMDLARAYRQLRIDPGDWELMGVKWRGKWFLDKTPAFGIWLGAHFCCRATNAVCFLAKKGGNPMFAYIDDFIGWKQTMQEAREAFEANSDILHRLGFEQSLDKATLPSTSVVWVGVHFDSIKMTMSIPHEKIMEVLQEVRTWMSETTIQLKELQKLLGRLFHATKCCTGARLFCNRLLDGLHTAYRQGYTDFTAEMHMDLQWMSAFLTEFNGIHLIRAPAPSQQVFVDSCLTAGGAIWGNNMFTARYTKAIMDCEWHISQLEAYTLLLAIRYWQKLWARSNVTIHCDNSATVAVM